MMLSSVTFLDLQIENLVHPIIQLSQADAFLQQIAYLLSPENGH